ncbi:MAG TPA: hypothetical protein PKY82_28540 [Pyrinomonadaceae bacterium]|nr:hypothetical protein [Pyrinomonadaceae bacterium]
MHNESLKLTLENIKTLQSYWYPGNVRELPNIVERAIILSNYSMLKFAVLQVIEKVIIKEISEAVTEKSIFTYQDLKSLERENIIRALKKKQQNLLKRRSNPKIRFKTDYPDFKNKSSTNTDAPEI